MDYTLDNVISELVLKECGSSGIMPTISILAAMKKLYYQGYYDAISLEHASKAAVVSGVFKEYSLEDN